MSDDPANGTTEVVELDDLAESIQSGQDIIESVEDDIPANALVALETVEDDVEGLEDTVEHVDGTLPSDFEADVQATQDDVNDLQETLTTAGVDPDLFRKVEDLEDTIETIEDRAVDARDQYGVKVDNAPVEFFDEATPTAESILSRFGKNTDDALVEVGTENTYSGTDEVDLSDPGVERFTSQPRTPGNA
ncbi:hypothetical protein DM2_2230 [Halorubrum sp. DM2]|uniref:hypothetical protein n=1 Tax=Halorubrum sp. DM2 TaxID=2527867 RepID=UPI0024B6C67C|nr:hypothetical protein [Halorubrum sp. DM2]VTT86192.1 hypothetical protein DM2_2230 [Halorubrum sp. DM2]